MPHRISFYAIGGIVLASLMGCQGARRTAAIHNAPDKPIAPNVAAWTSQSAGSASVAAYATELDRLNPSARAPFNVHDGVTLEEAEAITLVLNADLRAARMKARVPAVGAGQAGIAPDPRFELDLLQILDGISTPWILASGLKYTIPIAGRLRGEKLQALAEARTAMREAQLAEWNKVVELRTAWANWSADTQRLKLIEEHIASVNTITSIANTQRDAEQISAPQARVLELEAVSQEGEKLALSNQISAQVLSIKALMGLTPQAQIAPLPDLSIRPDTLGDVQESQTLSTRSLELALAKAEFVEADRVFRHEVSKSHPDVEFGPLLESDEGVGHLGLGLGMDLPIWNKNRRAITEACATRQAAGAAYQARYQDVTSKLARARADETAAVSRAQWLRDKVAPLADEQLSQIQALGKIGDMDVLILKDALSKVLETKLQLLDVQLEHVLANQRRRALIEPLRTPSFPTSHSTFSR